MVSGLYMDLISRFVEQLGVTQVSTPDSTGFGPVSMPKSKSARFIAAATSELSDMQRQSISLIL